MNDERHMKSSKILSKINCASAQCVTGSVGSSYKVNFSLNQIAVWKIRLEFFLNDIRLSLLSQLLF